MKAAVSRAAILSSRKPWGNLVGCLMIFENIGVVGIAANFVSKTAHFGLNIKLYSIAVHIFSIEQLYKMKLCACRPRYALFWLSIISS